MTLGKDRKTMTLGKDARQGRLLMVGDKEG